LVAERLEEARLSIVRFIDVEKGQKQSYDHSQYEPEVVTGNYGVYSGRGLIGFDIDDYQDDVDTSALEGLPATFTVTTPHGGEHWYYKGSKQAAAAICSATAGANNVSLSWGEIYAGGKYLVGPGSRITDCDKSHCHECGRSGGAYSIADDRSVSKITKGQILRVLSADPAFANSGLQTSIGVDSENEEWDPNSWRSAGRDPSSLPLEALEMEGRKGRLRRTVLREHQRSEAETGAKLREVLDTAEEVGLDSSWALEQIRRWLKTGRLKKPHARNRIAPADADLPRADAPAEIEQRGLDSFR
jgi:hypothetical protein